MNVICAYINEFRKCYIFYKVTCKCCDTLYVGNNQNNIQKNGTTLQRYGPKGNAR